MQTKIWQFYIKKQHMRLADQKKISTLPMPYIAFIGQDEQKKKSETCG